MPPKKRRQSQAADGEEPTTSAPKRRKTKLPTYDAQEICQELYDAIKTHRTDEGRVLCENFIRAPKRRSDPEYYNTVTVPMDLLKINSKIKSEEYDDVDQMTSDVQLMLNNAKSYYKPSSQEYIDACELWELYTETKSVILAEASGKNTESKDEAAEATETESEAPAEDDDIDDDATDEYVEEGVEINELAEDEDELTTDAEVAGGERMDVGDEAPKVSNKSRESTPSLESKPQERTVETPTQRAPVPEESDGGEEELDTREEGIDPQTSEILSMSLRERKYSYRDFITPKGTRKPKVEEAAKDEDEETDEKTDQEKVHELEQKLEELFDAVALAKDGERTICEMFKILPSRAKYPDYYEIIHDPIDLKTIAQKILNSQYRSLDELAKDLSVMVHNAKTFNEPGSQIYRDSVTLRKLVNTKKTDLDQPRPVRHVRSERIRSRRSVGGTKPVADIAALTEPEEVEIPLPDPAVVAQDDEMEDLEDSSTLSREDDPLWILFNTVRQWKNSLGQSLAEPFLKLPSRRIYPDYYEEIKKPMSLLKIKKKMKNQSYRDLDRLEKDMNLVFENAKQYNIDASKLYKDAVKLQSVMKDKKSELMSGQDELMEGVSPIMKGRRSVDTMSQGSEDERARRKPGRKSLMTSEEALRKRMNTLYKTVHEYQVNGRHLSDIFVKLPSKKDYPDYYMVISEPIDMSMIEEKIKISKYTGQDGLVQDFELMFNNARHYNEEKSQVYEDAEMLERVLMSKIRILPPLDGSPISARSGSKTTKSKRQTYATLGDKLNAMYTTIRDHADPRGRTLSTPFMKLPLKTEYPDYFEIIKKPIDMQKISQNVAAGKYNSVEDMVSDIVLVFDNACKYNEPDSLIYKDALTLQRVCLEKKNELCDDDANEVPDVKAVVQELMTTLFITTFNHSDEEGRCYSDSFMELPTKVPADDDDEGKEEGEKQMKPAPCFEQVKSNLTKGRYHRLDRFQEDMFEVFEFARSNSRLDSQVYEDCTELQMFFIKKRDMLCKNGEILLTPALSYTENHLNKALDAERKEKVVKEQKEDEEKKKSGEEDMETDKTREPTPGGDDSFDFGQLTYHIGDFVYIEPRESNMEPHIVCIEKLTKDVSGEQKIHGCWFLRPSETYHVATRKFLEKEVFKSEFNDSGRVDKVLGKCFVMHVKDYSKMKPEGFNEKDVYVCESRYTSRHKSFKKIKPTAWRHHSDQVKTVTRDVPLVPTRVASVFAEKSGDERGFLDDNTQNLDKDREEVVIENMAGGEEGCIYYEQCQTATTWIKLGDCVYVKSETSTQPAVARIDKLWTDQNGVTHFHGPYFILPNEVEHPPTRLFYKREVFRSSVEDTNPITNILGRCSVLAYKEYCSQRPTEVLEKDTYICESKYLEAEKAIKKFSKPMKKQSLSIQVCDDEIYFFKKPIIPNKEPSPLLMRPFDELGAVYTDEGSNMDSTLADSYSNAGDYPAPSTPVTDTPKEKKQKVGSEKKKSGQENKGKGKGRNISGYIVFAAEYRKEVAADNPDLSFGEISKIVGAKWKSLPKETKDRFEAKAKKLCEDQAAKQAEADKAFNESLSMFPPAASPGPDRSMSPGSSSRPMTPGGPYQQGYPQGFQGQFSNQQGSQGMMGMLPHGVAYNGMPPPHGPPHGPPPGAFGSPMHPNMGMAPQPRTPMAPGAPYPHPGTPQGGAPPGTLPGQQPAQMPPAPPPKPAEPMFVSVPPRTQRLLHSEAYLRYIEGLKPNSASVGDWERQLTASADNTHLQSTGKLPIHWLANGVGHHDNAVNALWALRDLMMKDTLTISRTLDFSQL